MGGGGASNPPPAGAAKPGKAIPQTIASSMAAQIRDGIRRGDKVRIVIEAPGSVRELIAKKAASCSFFVYFCFGCLHEQFRRRCNLIQHASNRQLDSLYLLHLLHQIVKCARRGSR